MFCFVALSASATLYHQTFDFAFGQGRESVPGVCLPGVLRPFWSGSAGPGGRRGCLAYRGAAGYPRADCGCYGAEPFCCEPQCGRAGEEGVGGDGLCWEGVLFPGV